MDAANPLARPPRAWRGKALARVSLLLVVGALVAALAAAFGIARDYGYLQASMLTGSAGGQYHALASRLAERAAREHGSLTAVATAGSIENVDRLAGGGGRCAEMFALIQDGTPVPAGARLELLGRLPEPESLLLLGRTGRGFGNVADLRGATIGIGPDGSGTAYLMKQLFADADLRGLDLRLSHHELSEQARLVAEGKLDLAAFVMQENAEFLGNVIRRHGLDIVAPSDLHGLVARYPWLSVGQIPAGRYDLVHPVPATDKPGRAPANPADCQPVCPARGSHRAAHVGRGGAAQLRPRQSAKVHGTRLGAAARTRGAAILPDRRARDRRPIFPVAGEPDVAGLLGLPGHGRDDPVQPDEGYSRFRLWRIDAAREKLETALKELVDPSLTHAQMRAVAGEQVMASPERRAAAQEIMDRLAALRARCQRQTNSIVTPMGDEMFYRYQQSLIDDAATTLGALLPRVRGS
jgi:TRAP-type uncharacterized transport system substrate-binding protein